MFEGIVAGLLNRVLGSYVQNFDSKQLNIGIWGGDVTLRDLKLKKESLDQLHLPLDVKFGELEELRLVIPWSNLKSKPVQITIDGLYLLAVPTLNHEWDEAEARRREVALKRHKVDELDEAEQAQAAPSGDQEGFAASFITKVVDNLQITIKNIYVRYEDCGSEGLCDDAYAVGLSLEELSAVSTDGNWKPSFISITDELTRKLLTLSQLSCYMDTETQSIYDSDSADLTKQGFLNTYDRQYLLKPVSGTGKLTLHKGGANATTPHINADIDFEEFGLKLDDTQYQDLLTTGTAFHGHQHTLKFRKFRPKTTVSEDPKAWFKYAAESVLSEIKDRNYQWSWDNFKTRRDQRQSYIELYTKKLTGTASEDEVKQLRSLEDDISFDDIKWYRLLTKQHMKDKGIKAKSPQPPQNKGWFGGWFGGGGSGASATGGGGPPKDQDAMVPGGFALTDEQRDALDDIIDYQEDKPEYCGDDSWVQWKMNARLGHGGVALNHHKVDLLGEMVFGGCSISVTNKLKSMVATFDLDEFRVEDGTNTSVYRHVVSVSDDDKSESSFLSIKYEDNPEDGLADKAVGVELKSMTIFYNPKFIESIIKFFTAQVHDVDTVGAIINAAKDQGGEFINQMTRIGLQYALEEHKTINLILDLQAPLIIAPLNPNSYQSPVAILDAGHVSVTSILGDKTKMEEIRKKTNYDHEDWDSLKQLMYDRYQLELRDASFCVGPDIKSTMEKLHSPDNSTAIFDSLDLTLTLGVSILPEVVQLPKVKVEGDVPEAKLVINDFQYKTLMEIIDRAIPGDDDSPQQKPQVEEEKSHQPVTKGDLKQHEIDFSLQFHKAEIVLYRCTDNKTMAASFFADMKGSDIKVNYWQSGEQAHCDVVLTTLKVVNQNRMALISGLETKDSSCLLKVNWDRHRRVAKWKGQDIEVLDMQTDVNISAVQFIVCRSSWLSIINFIQNTFVDPDPEPLASDELAGNSVHDEAAPAKNIVNVTFDRVLADFVEQDGRVRVGSLKLSKADLAMLITAEFSETKGKLGKLVLEEGENRELLSIDSDNLVDFTYRSYEGKDTKVSQEIDITTGAMTVYFFESSIVHLVTYFSQFGQMQEMFTAARESVVGSKPLQSPQKTKFDIVVDAPTIIFPQLKDFATVKLGQLYANNQFENGHNLIKCGVRNSSVSTHFVFDDDQFPQDLSILDNTDIGFEVDYCETKISVTGKTPDIEVKLTEVQAQYLSNMAAAIQRVADFDAPSVPVNENIVGLVEAETANAKAVVYPHKEETPDSQKVAEQIVEEVTHTPPPEPVSTPFAVDVRVPKVSLTVYNHTEDKNADEVAKCAIGMFALHNLGVSMESTQGDDWKGAISMHSISVQDKRESTTSKFREIIPTLNNDDQFKVQVDKEGRTLSVLLNVDRPKMYISLDWLCDLQEWYDAVFADDPNDGIAVDSTSSDPSRRQSVLGGARRRASMSIGSSAHDHDHPAVKVTEKKEAPPIVIGYNINITDPSILLLADSSRVDSKALVFKVEQVLVTKQNVMSIATKNIGLYLASMDQPKDSTYRIIDDFSASFAYNTAGSTDTSLMTQIHLSVDPLLVKVSVKDIRLAMTVIERTQAMWQSRQPEIDDGKSSAIFTFEDLQNKVADYAPSILSADDDSAKLVVNGEEFNGQFGGMRFLLIGEVHELPVVDINVNSFDVKCTNWSSNLSGEVHVDSNINIFNYSQSSWEQLLQKWPLSVYMNRPEKTLLIDVVSRESAEVTLTSRTIALMSQLQVMISNIDEPLKPRGEDKPYLLVNQTGVPIRISADQVQPVEIATGDSCLWAFEDWMEVRQSSPQEIFANHEPNLTVQLLSSSYDPMDVSLRGEGAEIYMLGPKVGEKHARLVCEILLREDNVKRVVFKSTVTFHNVLDRSIRILTGSNELVIGANEEVAVPIDDVLVGTTRLAPDDNTHQYSETDLSWAALVKNRHQVITCLPTGDGQREYFFIEAQIDDKEPLTKVYPHMTVVVSSPVEIENLLPFTYHYSLYDKSLGVSWKGSTAMGETTHLHVADFKKSQLFFAIEPEGYPQSEFIHLNNQEQVVPISMASTLLELRVHYSANSANMKVSIYSPYIVLNQSMKNLHICDQKDSDNVFKSEWRDPRPLLYSYSGGGDNKSRSLIASQDTKWTEPISFESAGQSVPATAQISGKQLEQDFAVGVKYGQGKFHHTKVVTVTPRYVVRNRYGSSLSLLEVGVVKSTPIANGEDLPLYNLRRSDAKSVMLSLANSKWSSPFCIDDVGQLSIKLIHPDQYQVLVKVTVRLVGATVFITFEPNPDWPFQFRNFTDDTFYIYQTNPNVNENGEVIKNDTEYKPIYYKLPPKSVMPWAYDYPNAIINEVAFRSGNHERAVSLAEIGKLPKFRVDDHYDDMDVIAEGPVTSMAIRPHDGGRSVPDSASMVTTSTTATGMDNLDDQDEQSTTIKVVAKFDGIGISMVNSYRSQELCYCTFKGIELRYNESDNLQNISVKLKWIQVDNQLYGGIFPIVVYPTVVPLSSREINQHPAFHGAISRVKDKPDSDVASGVLFIKYATLLLQEMSIEIDEDFLVALLDFAKIPGASWNAVSKDELFDIGDISPLPQPADLEGSQLDVYFEALHLQPMQLDLSFMRTDRVSTESDDDAAASSSSTLMFLFNVLTMAVGNVNDAPIKLNALFIENIRSSPALLIDSIQNHYAQSFFYQVHKILGSADFLGNPVGLFKHLSSGVMDIFYEPYQGFIINDRPQEIGIGLAKGGLKFVKKSVFGVSDSVAKVTGSIAKGLSVATDSTYQERRRKALRRNRPKHALYGFGTGVESLFESVTSGITGLAQAPIQGAETGGAAGFFKGVGQGLIGLPTKTAIGIFDFASNVSEGIRNTTTVFDYEGLDKVRLPRYIAPNQPIAPYSAYSAQGQYWLMLVNSGAFMNSTYVADLLLTGTDMCALVTYTEIIVFDINTMLSKTVVPFSRLTEVGKEHSGIELKQQRTNPVFIPIADKKMKDFFYDKIGQAVKDFNKKWRVEE